MQSASVMRDRSITQKILAGINKFAGQIGRPIHLMHVCGTHEATICKYGLRSLLPENIHILSGPGCPVCVCPAEDVERAIYLANQSNIVLTTFGDMVRVPADDLSLAKVRSKGANVQVVYSPHDAAQLAKANPTKEIVFFAIGFETTAPVVGYEILHAPPNFSIICAHKTIPPAMELLMSIDGLNIDGFIAPGHVSSIIGTKPFEIFSQAYHMPNVIAGFEPNDLLLAILMLLRQLSKKEAKTENEYTRVVKAEGNIEAQKIIGEVFEQATVRWRGIGRVREGGYVLRDKFSAIDACAKFQVPPPKVHDIPPGCNCHLVMTGKIFPYECKLFRSKCTPQNPVGPCMVSNEGTCQIFFKYGQEKPS